MPNKAAIELNAVFFIKFLLFGFSVNAIGILVSNEIVN
ncbi:hypothetical protein ADICYQ_3064 [Cyclobacterium qasimii M12-11B]|uniref:Uncharacterized protein n=1 Tax=Cyclobacterium qasimii M12-11B TaxID=641524 RepID=S7VEL3_9BACT|nr:hypothetical protein ADICYQ_3064 [Cyclobacterium qasimii M12-11B]